MLPAELTVDMYPFWIYQKISRKERRLLRKKGVKITFHEHYVRFDFPTMGILSRFRQRHLRVSLIIYCSSLHNLLLFKYEQKDIHQYRSA